MKYSFYLFTTLVLALLLGAGCGPDERTTLYIDQKTKDYVVFHPGSWWAYQEHSSSAVDTVSVYNAKNEIVSIEELSTKDFEEDKMNLKWSSYIGHTAFLRVNADYNANQNKGVVEEQYPWFLYPNIVYLPFDSVGDNRWIWDYDTFHYEQFYDSLEVQNNMYYEVMEISTTNNVHSKKQRRIWWAKHVGRIHWETFGGEYWELTDYDIMQ